MRNGCSAEADTVATIAAGAPVTIRYALAGEATPCYKVVVEQNGKAVEGYLSAAEIAGIDQFEQQRREAAMVNSTPAAKDLMPRMPAIAANTGIALEASRLIADSQPAKALQLLEPELIKQHDANLLAIAGYAAWRADEGRRALEYWRSSLDLDPNPDLERSYRRLEREVRADRSTEKLIGLRVTLRYDSAAVPAETARQMLAALDQEFIRISGALGCAPEERIAAIVQTREAYRKSTDVEEWNAGQFDGRIRVPVVSGQAMDASMRRIFAHETTHACLSLLGSWPAWLHEGLAQKFSGDAVTPSARQKIATLVKEHRIPRLENLGQDWSRLDAEHAAAAYAISLAAVDLFFEEYAQLGIVNLLHNPDRLAAIAADLDKRLGL